MIITIARQCGCEGDEVGRKLSEIYGIPCYSKKELIELAKEKKVDDRLYFEDMAIYSMVKNNTFNGIPLPDIAVMDESGECKVIRSFSYEDFKGRLS